MIFEDVFGHLQLFMLFGGALFWECLSGERRERFPSPVSSANGWETTDDARGYRKGELSKPIAGMAVAVPDCQTA